MYLKVDKKITFIWQNWEKIVKPITSIVNAHDWLEDSWSAKCFYKLKPKVKFLAYKVRVFNFVFLYRLNLWFVDIPKMVNNVYGIEGVRNFNSLHNT